MYERGVIAVVAALIGCGERPGAGAVEVSAAHAGQGAACGPAVTALRGEPGGPGPVGPTGPLGPTGPGPVVETAGSVSGDGSAADPIAFDPSGWAGYLEAGRIIGVAARAAPAQQIADPEALAGQSARYTPAFSPGDPQNTAFQITSVDLGVPIAVRRSTVTVRAKVTGNGSGAVLAELRCRAVRAGGGMPVGIGSAAIVPSSFSGNLTWREIDTACAFRPDDLQQSLHIESFNGVTDLWLDYIRVMPRAHEPTTALWIQQFSVTGGGAGDGWCATVNAVCTSATVRAVTCTSVSGCTGTICSTCSGQGAPFIYQDCNHQLQSAGWSASCLGNPTGGCTNFFSNYIFQAALVNCVRLGP